MKRITLLLIAAVALTISTTSSASAAVKSFGHGYVSHATPAHGYVAPKHSLFTPRHGYNSHVYIAPTYSHGVVQQSYAGHNYVRKTHNRSNYSAYGHNGNAQISTPYFGLSFGH